MSTRRALTYLGSHLGARESRPNRLAAAAAGVAGLQAGLWPALGKLWRGAGGALVRDSASESDFFCESEEGQFGVRTQEHNALSHITRDILQQCSEEFRPGPEPLGRQDMRIGR